MTTEPMAETYPERAEQALALRAEARFMLGRSGEKEDWLIEDRSPGRRIHILYSMHDGMRTDIHEHLVEEALSRRVNGRPMFTARQENAPQYKPGTTLCFKHPDAPESVVLRDLGIISDCNANELRNRDAMRAHAEHKHGPSWKTYQNHLTQIREDEAKARQEDQIAATLRLAEAAEGSRRRGKGTNDDPAT